VFYQLFALLHRYKPLDVGGPKEILVASVTQAQARVTADLAILVAQVAQALQVHHRITAVKRNTKAVNQRSMERTKAVNHRSMVLKDGSLSIIHVH